MSEELSHTAVSDLDELLDAEKAALLTGDIDKIGRLTERKEELIARVDTLPNLPPTVLTPLQTKLRRNHDLIEHALEGIRAAAGRLKEMRQVRESLQTYDRKGTLRDVATSVGRSVEKRA